MSTNNFDRVELQRWFMDWYKCYYCGQNGWDCFHHIKGRGIPGHDEESSILNAAPLCNQMCHLPNHGRIRTDEVSDEYLKQTYEMLLEQCYPFTEKDKRFIEKYINAYL